MDVAWMPHLNAALNATSGVFLISGFVAIRREKKSLHKKCMAAALAASFAFLISYVVYHWSGGLTTFTGSGWVRPVYYVILATHVALAAAVPPLAIVTVRRAMRGDFERHKKIARVAFPIWLYVSVTGVLVYWLLYHAYPGERT